MSQLDASIVTVAFPTLQHDFHAGVGAVTWVGLSYLVTLITLITAMGRMSDMVGRKIIYIYGFLIFILGSALCGLAPNLDALIGARILQGVGAAMFQANSVAIIVLAVPKDRLGRAIGIQGASQALGLAMGPSIGGLLIALGGWRLIFYVNVPAGIIGAIMGWYLIPRSRHLQPRVRFDWLGLGVFIPTIAAFLFAVSYGDKIGWMSPTIGVLFLVTVVGAWLFLRRERRTLAPMLDLSLFKRLPFSAGIASGLLSYLVMFGSLFVVPFYLERGLGQSTGRAGLELTVMPIALGLTAPFAGRLAERLGARSLTMTGMLLVALSMGLLAVFNHSIPVILVELALLGIGLGMFTPPNNAAIMGSAPREQAGVASGVLNMTRGMGTAMGLAFTSLVFGLYAGTSSTSASLATRGFEASAIFLGLVALSAMGLSALRGKSSLNLDPVANAE
jgi:EmrB/QacA subfamily drug resistance transporter